MSQQGEQTQFMGRRGQSAVNTLTEEMRCTVEEIVGGPKGIGSEPLYRKLAEHVKLLGDTEASQEFITVRLRLFLEGVPFGLRGKRLWAFFCATQEVMRHSGKFPGECTFHDFFEACAQRGAHLRQRKRRR